MPTVSGPLFRYTVGGTIGGSEIFSFGRWVTYGPGGPGGTAEAYLLSNLSTDITNLLNTVVGGVAGVTSMRAAFPTTVAFTVQTVAEYNPLTGKQVRAGVQQSLVGQAGSSATTALPNQCAHCITLRSAPRGRRTKNRFYLPPYVTAAMVGGSSVALGVTNAVNNWLHAQQQALLSLAGPIQFVQYSAADTSMNQITDAYTGSIIDTIRRRRNKLNEVRTTTVI